MDPKTNLPFDLDAYGAKVEAWYRDWYAAPHGACAICLSATPYPVRAGRAHHRCAVVHHEQMGEWVDYE